MFKPNHQMGLGEDQVKMEGRKRKRYEESWELCFFKTIFNNINEREFEVLYSDKASRPNCPINCMVGALIMMTAFEWTYEELFDQLDFNILTRAALGITDINYTPFTVVTLINFQNRVLDHMIETGEDLFEKLFKSLTTKQLEELKIKGNIQRADSFQVASNIKRRGRVELIVEVLRRFHGALNDRDKGLFAARFTPYMKPQTSGHFVYHLKPSDISHEMTKLGCFYKELLETYRENYAGSRAYEILERVYHDHFKDSANGVIVKAAEELKSDALQSPDDVSATYRKKSGKEYVGRVISVVETAHPDNPLNLITDVTVAPNNTDDAKNLNGRLDKMRSITPELEELHTDAAYGNEPNDRKMDELGIMHVQTAIKGRVSEHLIEIKRIGKSSFCAKCPQQKVKAEIRGKRYRAVFAFSNCAGCRHVEKCPVKEIKQGRAYYFDEAEYLKQRRQRNINRVSKRRKKLRANVEATVCEYVGMTTDQKLKIRGGFKTAVFALLGAICINYGRIYRYKMDPKGKKPHIFDVFMNFIRIILDYFFKEPILKMKSSCA